MRCFVILIFMFCYFPAFSQNNEFLEKPFIRVFGFSGNKIGKGRISVLTETYLIITSQSKTDSISVKKISIIKTNRSFGHLPLVFGATGFALGAGIVGISYNDDAILFGRGFEMVGTGIFFGLASSALGAIFSGTKNNEVYKIDGDFVKLKELLNKFENGNELDLENNLASLVKQKI